MAALCLERWNDMAEPNLTLGLDFQRGRIVGEIDGLAAIQQAAKLALEIPRFQHVILP